MNSLTTATAIPPTRRIRIDASDTRLLINVGAAVRSKDVVGLLFCASFFAVVFVASLVTAPAKLDLAHAVVPIGVFLMGVFGAWQMLWLLFSREQFEVSEGKLRLRRRLVLWRTRAFAIAKIGELSVALEVRPRSKGRGRSLNYRTLSFEYEGRRARSEGFLTRGEAEWIRDVLTEHLAFERAAV
ncbi:MAG: hypothetical protein JWM74_3528 [Myxococcaceae bacterium]|nr:hypothetical protein [Myxococcaceae bacterium]